MEPNIEEDVAREDREDREDHEDREDREDCKDCKDREELPRTALETIKKHPASRAVRTLMTALIHVHGCAHRHFSILEAETLTDWLLLGLGLVAVWPWTRMPAYLEELWGLIAARTREYPLFCKLATVMLPLELRRTKLCMPCFDPLATPASLRQMREFCILMVKNHEHRLPMQLPTGVGKCVVDVRWLHHRFRAALDEPATTSTLFDFLALRGIVGNCSLTFYSKNRKTYIIARNYYFPEPLEHETIVHVYPRLRGC